MSQWKYSNARAGRRRGRKERRKEGRGEEEKRDKSLSGSVFKRLLVWTFTVWDLGWGSSL